MFMEVYFVRINKIYWLKIEPVFFFFFSITESALWDFFVLAISINKIPIELFFQRYEISAIRKAFTGFGKAEITELKLHPDSFVQMALQLAYYTIHNK